MAGTSTILGEAALALYGLAGRVVQPFAGSLMTGRERRGKEDAGRRGERFGIARLGRPAGPLVWVHAASVGETVATLPLTETLTARGLAVLLTTGTVTAAGVAARRLPSGAVHQYVPIDTPGAVGAFLDHWRPDLVLFAESEIWPTTVKAIAARALPLVLVNARMSERSFRGWRRFAPLARALVGRIDLALAQSPADAARLTALGAPRVEVSGNLKFDVPPPSADPDALIALRARIGGRPVFLAASTHPGEETAAIAAHLSVAARRPDLLTIIAPRHPERGDAIAAEIAAAGLRPARHGRGEAVEPTTDILLADTIGDMGLWYRSADLAFLGGSIARRGGQNPIEPAKLGVPVLHGVHVENFGDVFAALGGAGAAITVADGDALAVQVGRLIGDAGERERLAREARACVERFTGALGRTTDALKPYLKDLVGAAAHSA